MKSITFMILLITIIVSLNDKRLFKGKIDAKVKIK